MKIETAITILQEYNQWRRGENMMISMPNTKDIGEAIDEAIKVLKDSLALATDPEIERRTGWYVVDETDWEEYISYEDLENNTRYGLTSNGDWFTGSIGEVDWSHMVPATEEQIKTKVGNYIKSKGYKVGTVVKSMVTGKVHPILIDDLRVNDYSKCIMFGGVTIMKKGRWSPIFGNKLEDDGIELSVPLKDLHPVIAYSLVSSFKYISSPKEDTKGLKSSPKKGDSSFDDVRKALDITSEQNVAIFTMEEFAEILSSLPDNIELKGVVEHIFSKRSNYEK